MQVSKSMGFLNGGWKARSLEMHSLPVDSITVAGVPDVSLPAKVPLDKQSRYSVLESVLASE